MHSDTFYYKFEDFGASPLSLHRSYKAFISPYKPYQEFDDPFDIKPFHNIDRNLCLDFYDFPGSKQLFFPFDKLDKKSMMEINDELLSEDLTRDTISRKEEGEITKEPFQDLRPSKVEMVESISQLTNESVMNGFIDLVDQSSLFYLEKLANVNMKTLNSVENKEVQTKGSKEENLKSIRNYRCSSQSPLHSRPRSLEKAYIEEIGQNVKSAEAMEFSNDRKVNKIIKKIPRKTLRKWTKTDDKKLLNLSQKFQYDWKKIRKGFNNHLVSSQFLQRRYNQLKTAAEEKLKEFQKELILHPNQQSVQKHFIAPNHYEIEKEGGGFNLIEESSVKQEEYIKTFKPEEKLGQMDDEMFDSFFIKEENLNENLTTFNNDFFSYKKIEEDQAEISPKQQKNALKIDEGLYEEGNWEEKSTKDSIEILNSRISLLTSLYNQTRIELNKLQRELNR